MHLLAIAIPYFLISGYVAWRSAGALGFKKYGRLIWILLILFLSASLPVGFFVGENVAGNALRVAGVTWILTLPYWALAAVFFEVVRIITGCFGRRGVACDARERLGNSNDIGFSRRRGGLRERSPYLLAGTAAFVALLFVAGHFHFKNPVVVPLEISIPKRAGDMRELHAVVVADMHLGDFIGREQLVDYVNRINALKPDIILIPGDTIDRSLAPLIRFGAAEELRKLRAPLGVYTILGNHEGFAGNAASTSFLASAGMRVLRDESELVAGAFYLVGRDDGKQRKTISELARKIDFSKPVILLNHRPDELSEADAGGFDLQLSGHTHDGQIWPINWINRFLIWEVSHGYARKEHLQIYVTSGLGLWGLPVRIGTDSEIVDLRIKFKTDSEARYSIFE